MIVANLLMDNLWGYSIKNLWKAYKMPHWPGGEVFKVDYHTLDMIIVDVDIHDAIASKYKIEPP